MCRALLLWLEQIHFVNVRKNDGTARQTDRRTPDSYITLPLDVANVTLRLHGERQNQNSDKSLAWTVHVGRDFKKIHYNYHVLLSSIETITRKHRQSYRHADPRRQLQHTATAVAARVTSNRATVKVFVIVWSWPFDLLTSGSIYAERLLCSRTCTKFGVDSSRRFSFRAQTNRQTNRQTRLNALPPPAAVQPARVIKRNLFLTITKLILILNFTF